MQLWFCFDFFLSLSFNLTQKSDRAKKKVFVHKMKQPKNKVDRKKRLV
jgi:hypothetical protein